MSDVLNKNLTNNAAGGTTTFTTLNRFTVGTLTDPGFTVAYIRIRLRPTTTAGNNFVFDNWFIGHRDNAGEFWDFVGDQVRITFGGQNGITLVPNTADIYSDVIAFALDVTKDLIIAYDGPAGTSRSVRNMPSGTFSGINLHFKSSVQEASLTNKSAYGTSNGRLDIINLIEAFPSDSSSLADEASSNYMLDHSSEHASSDRLQHERDSSDKAIFDAASSSGYHEAQSSSGYHEAQSSSGYHEAQSSSGAFEAASSSNAEMVSSDSAASSDKRDHDAASSDFAAGGQASSSDQLLSEQVSSDIAQHERDSSDKADRDAVSSDAAASSNAEMASSDAAASSDKAIRDAASSSDLHDGGSASDDAASSDKVLHDQASSEFQSDLRADTHVPIQVVVTVTV